MKYCLSLVVLLAACAYGEVVTTERALKRGGDELKEVRHRVRLANHTVSFNGTENLTKQEVVWAVQPEMGRWQRHIFFLSGNEKFGTDAIVWEVENGNQTNAGIRIPRLKNGAPDGFTEIDAVALADYPDWVFFRYTNMHFVYLGVVVQEGTMNKEKSQLFMAYPGTPMAALGDDLPWKNQLPGFNAAAFYSRGGIGGDQCELLVFDGVSQLGAPRWKKDDDRCTLSLISQAKTLYFAMASRKGENGEKTAAPKFLAEEQQKVLAALRGIQWDFAVDMNAVRKEYDEIGGLLRKTPNAEMQKKYDALVLPAGNSKEDNIQALNIRNTLKTIRGSLSGSQLESLFD